MNLRSEAVPAPAGGPCLLVHGGAWAIPDDALDAHRDGLTRAIERGRALLEGGADALSIVTETVAVMEAHGAFDAGRGAVLNREGEVELDAGVMDGPTRAFGSVAGVRRLLHPVRAARRLLGEGQGQVRLLVGVHAERFAEATGMPLVENAELICDRERARYEALREEARFHTSHAFLPAREAPRGTVGCVARDAAGGLAAATSTGGTPFRPAGRVGDTPLPGAGFFAEPHAAASATGWGEAIATVLLCGRAVDRMAGGASPLEAARQGLEAMYRDVRNRDGEGAAGGLIVLGRDGAGAWAYTTPRMARGGWRAGAEAWVAV